MAGKGKRGPKPFCWTDRKTTDIDPDERVRPERIKHQNALKQKYGYPEMPDINFGDLPPRVRGAGSGMVIRKDEGREEELGPQCPSGTGSSLYTGSRVKEVNPGFSVAVDEYRDELLRAMSGMDTASVRARERARARGYQDKKDEGARVMLEYQPQPKQMLLHASPANEILYGGAAGPGKAQPLDSTVFTPFGLRQMGSLKVGDLVCNPDGSVGRVILVHPWGEMDIYRVTFRDGGSTEATGEHLWKVWRGRRGRKVKNKRIFGEESAEIRTTEQIRFSRGKFFVPVTKPVVFTTTARYSVRPVDPWLLGVLIGDGYLDGYVTRVTTGDAEIIDRLKGILGDDFRGPWPKDKRSKNFTVGVRPASKINDYLRKVRLLGKHSHEKFIPVSYLFGTIEERWELLRGLMDTDGWSNKRDGDCYFSTSSEELAEHVVYLARSLGGIASLRKKKTGYKKNGEFKECRRAYIVRLKFRHPGDCFSLSRKKENCAEGYQCMGREIIKIEFSRRAECQCITISNPNGLYITDDFIVTHNSHALRMEALTWCLRIPGLQAYLFRREYPDLEKNHVIPSLNQFPATAGKYKDQKKRWEFTNGSMLHFCHCQYEKDVFGFQGAEIHLLLIDELTSFTEFMYDYLRGRNRCSLDFVGMKLPIEYHHKIPGIICASNPGGVGHQFVKQRWVDYAPPYTLKRAEAKEGGMLRCYIPGVLADNQILAKMDPGYTNKLDALPEPYRTAYKDGDWNIFLGQAFAFRYDRHVVDAQEMPDSPPDGAPIYFGFDWGFGKPFSCVWCWVDADGRLFQFGELYGQLPGSDPDTGKRMTDSEIAEEIVEYEKKLKIDGRRIVRYSDPTCHNKKPDYRGGGQGPSTAEVFAHHKIFLTPGDPSRHLKIRQFHERLRVKKDKDGKELPDMPMLMVYDICKHTIRTIPTLQSDKNDAEDIDTKGEDHVYDALALICMARPLKLDMTLKGAGKTRLDERLERLEREHNRDDYEGMLYRNQRETAADIMSSDWRAGERNIDWDNGFDGEFQEEKPYGGTIKVMK